MHETDDNYNSESVNIDTERLYINVNLRVVSTVYPRDRAVTRLLHNKPNTDELMSNIALAETDLIHIAPLPLQGLCNALLTKSEDVIWPFPETIAAITRLAIEVLTTPSSSSKTFRSTCSSTPSAT